QGADHGGGGEVVVGQAREGPQVQMQVAAASPARATAACDQEIVGCAAGGLEDQARLLPEGKTVVAAIGDERERGARARVDGEDRVIVAAGGVGLVQDIGAGAEPVPD